MPCTSSPAPPPSPSPPLNLGFHGGGFDGFDLGSVATPALLQIAETGDGTMWRAAFIGDAGLRADQHSVVAHNFAELAAFNGLATGGGYTFTSGLGADTAVYRIDFSTAPVPEPEPESYAMVAVDLLALGVLMRRRRSPAPGKFATR